MIVVSQTWELALPGCTSLKEKRSVIRSLRDRLRNRFNLSVAETDWHDATDRAKLSVALVTTDGRFAETVMGKADRLVEAHGGALITSVRKEIH